MTVTLHLKPELEAGLLAQAQASGMTPEGYLQYLVEKELSADAVEGGSAEGSGMLWEDGLLIYGAGTALPAGFIDQCHQTFPRRKIATSPGPPRLKRFFDSSVLIPAFYAHDAVKAVGSSIVNLYKSVSGPTLLKRSVKWRFSSAPLNFVLSVKFVVSTTSVSPSQWPRGSPL